MIGLKKGRGSKIRFHKNNKKVVLLVHCFRASPRILGELSDILYNQGYSIYNLRLPGHGLVDENEMLIVRKGDWLLYTENILLDLIDSLRQTLPASYNFL